MGSAFDRKAAPCDGKGKVYVFAGIDLVWIDSQAAAQAVFNSAVDRWVGGGVGNGDVYRLYPQPGIDIHNTDLSLGRPCHPGERGR